MISSGTGFNMQLRNNIPIAKSNIGYLYSIDSPATEISPVLKILDRCAKIKGKINLYVFDQAIYAKAMAKWKYPMKRFHEHCLEYTCISNVIQLVHFLVKPI